MVQILSSKIFWIIVIIIVIISFIIGLNLKPAFQAETSLLFLPRNSASAININQIIGNAQKVTKTLKFYNAVLTTDEGIEDRVQELPDNKRQEYWDSKITTERLSDSSIMIIRTTDENQLQAIMIAEQTARTLSQELSRYYNIRNELETRIIDDTKISSHASFKNLLRLLILSLLIGFFLPLIFFLVNGLLGPAPKPKKRRAERNQEFTDSNFYPSEDTTFSEDRWSSTKKAPAPENLPFEDQIAFDEEPRENRPNHIFNSLGQITKKNSTREATPEEVKARLNRLLSGEM